MPEVPAPLFGRCWPTAPQRQLLTAALALDGTAVDAWRRWHAAGHLDRTDEGSFRLLPLVYHNLQACGFDDPVMAILKGIARRAWANNQFLLRELLPMVAELESGGTPTLLLKGPALAARYYANLSLRPMRDIDILMPEDQILSLITDLQQRGWTLKTWVPSRVRPSFCRFRHSVSLANSRMHEVDFHWHVMMRCGRTSVDEAFWGRAVPLELMGVKTRALDPTDQLLLACSHGPEVDEIAPLRWIADSITILRSSHPIDWQRLVDFVLEERLILPTLDALRLLRDGFRAPIPEDVIARLSTARLSWAEKAEAGRFLDETLQPLPVALAGLYVHHRRCSRDQSMGRTTLGFLRYMQYYWKLDSPWAILPRSQTWIHRRYGRARPDARRMSS